MPESPKNLGELFLSSAKAHPSKNALLYKQKGCYQAITWEEVREKVTAVASGLLQNGLKAGDRLVILSENRPEWAVLDLAAQMMGAVTVPIYPSLTPAELRYIADDCKAGMAAVSGKVQFDKLPGILKTLPALRAVIVFDSSLAAHGDEIAVPMLRMHELEKTAVDQAALDEATRRIGPDEVASIIYTSGTTGFPKGVMLTHSNFITNVRMSRTALKMGGTDVHLSFLPLCHVFERMAGHYLMLFIGATIAYAESLDTVPQNLTEVKPTFILGVPRFFEKIKDRVLEAVAKSGPAKKGLFQWAKALGAQKRQIVAAGKRPGPLLQIKLALAGVLVYKKFRARLGGRVRFCVSGGAPLPKETAEFFCDLGVMIYEGYGLTETAPVISANRENRFKFGTVGIPLEGVEVRIAEDGEILTKSPCVMKGYYKRDAETREVLIDGWFHTGDLGKIDRDGFLSITGRKKELIVTSGGKKVSPRPIEEAIEADPYILHCVLFGEGQRFLTALLVPREDKIRAYADEQKIPYASYEALLTDEKIRRFFESRLEALCADLASFEKIKYAALLPHDFTQSAGELTPTFKVKRETVLARYRHLLLPFYEREGPQA